MASSVWQDLLDTACVTEGIDPPFFQIASDRRGGRTAWSSSVLVDGKMFQSRFWYDGKNLNNAKEDAAELAYNYLQVRNASPPIASICRTSTWAT